MALPTLQAEAGRIQLAQSSLLCRQSLRLRSRCASKGAVASLIFPHWFGSSLVLSVLSGPQVATSDATGPSAGAMDPFNSSTENPSGASGGTGSFAQGDDAGCCG